MAGRKLGGLAALLLSLSIVACSNWLADEQQLMQKAIAYLDARDVNSAIIELKNVLQISPENARARYLLAAINLDYGDFETAIKEFRRAEAAGWSREESLIGVARALQGMARFDELRVTTAQSDASWSRTGRATLLSLQAVAEAGLGETEQAATLLEQAAQIDPAAPQVLMVRGQLDLLAGNVDEALAVLNSAVEKYPDDQEVRLLAANAYHRSGRIETATRLYQRVVDSDPQGFISRQGRNARLQLVSLHIMTGEYPQAEAMLGPLYGRDANDPVTNYLGGVLAFERGDYVRSEQLLLKVLKLAPEHNPTRLLYGTVNFAEGNYEQAAYFLSKYLLAAPDNLVVRKLLARSYILLDRPEQARSVLHAAQIGETGDAELLALVGISELARGARRVGISELEKALKLDSGNLPIRTELARAYIETGDTGQAIRELKEILAAGGERLQTGTLLVLAHLRAGDFTQAINGALEMLQEQRDDPALLTLAGNVFAASGDHAEARRYLRKALERSPDLPPALLTLAKIEELEKNYPAATGLYKRLAEMNLPSSIPLLALARVAEQQGNTELMLSWLQRAVDHAPDDSQPRLLLAEYHLRRGAVELARPLVRAVLDKTPSDPAALALQGRMFMAGRAYKEALVPLQRLQVLQPDSVVASVLLGECYLELGRIPNARDQLETALGIDSANVPAMALMARLELVGENGSSARALELAKGIQKIYPEVYLGYELAGDALMARGEPMVAGEEYAHALERMQRTDLVLKQAESISRAGNTDAAVAYLQDWLSRHPGDVQARQTLGAMWQNAGKTQLATAEYERVLELDGRNPVALNNLAGLYQLAGRQEALGLAQRALQVAPDNPGVMDTYAWIQVQQGEVQEGLQLLERAVQLLPENAEVRYHHAVAVYRAGEVDKGVRLLKALLQDGGDFSGRADAQRLLEQGGS